MNIEQQSGLTPGELSRLAAMIFAPETLRSPLLREQTLVETFAIWRAAAEVIRREGEMAAERQKIADLVAPEETQGGKAAVPAKDYSLEEAWEILGYKCTRGERSLLELAGALDAIHPEQFSGLVSASRRGLLARIELTRRVSEFQLNALADFKRRCAQGGGRKKLLAQAARNREKTRPK